VSVKKTLAVYEEVAAKAGRTGLPSSLPAEKAS
jgi:hypothetical protein